MWRLRFVLPALLVPWLVGCGGEEPLAEAPLSVLAADPGAYHERRVATEGVVRHFEEPLHYWIEDEHPHRVELFPHEMIAPHLGERVRVEGRFAYSREAGRRLTLERVEPLATE